MQSQDVAPRPTPAASGGPVVDVEQAEAALVEHYPRLVRLAYLVVPPTLSRGRRVLGAHALVQRALPRGRAAAPVIPAQSTGGRDGDPGYAYVRLRVLRTALETGLPLRRRAWPKRAQLPPVLPQVWGLRLFPRSGGADELALDQRLSALSGPARAVYALRGLERLTDAEVRKTLAGAGVEETDVDAALAEADAVPARYALLESPEFDPCSLQARPTDLMRRRQHLRAAVAATAAVVVCGTLLGLPGDGWGPDGAAAPSYAQNPSARAALDPSRLVKVSPAAWKSSTRTDFTVWPARGELTGDADLLRRALAVWARPGDRVQVSATPDTPTGGPAGPPQLLFAGVVDSARVVIFHDGLRLTRYAEPKDGQAGAALDVARLDGATAAEATAVVLNRTDGNVRYLTAPWVTGAAERDLVKPGSGAMELTVTDGVTSPMASPATRSGACTSWNVLQLTTGDGTRLASDLGELVPARLTTGRPGEVHDASGAEALRTWSPYACSLAAVQGQGVRTVNAWSYAEQELPDGGGTASWVCTRAETWRGGGERVLAQFHTPGGTYGAVAAKGENVPACGAREPQVLAGVLWKSGTGAWYLLAAGGRDTASIETSGEVRASVEGRLLAVRTEEGAQAGLKGTLEDGRTIEALR
ncbi:hypothetical protein ABZX40_08215 [Streptomyces sp. NPDC004610]|uniref:hypothetical protein n=1 Tax=unclassified Streptomyces TaxID=2593676 RepID=UPI0033BEDF11